MKSKLPIAFVLAAVLAAGCGSGGGGVEVTAQGQVEGCLTGNVMVLLLLANQASEIIAIIEDGGEPGFVETSEENWDVDLDVSLFGFGGDVDTNISGMVVEPAQAGGVYQFNNIVITSLGEAPISGTADVDVRIVNESTVVITGTLTINDALSDCDTTLTIPEPGLTLIGGFLEIERQLAAEFIEATVFGTLQFFLDFANSQNVGGTAVIPDDSQTVSVTTTSGDLGDFTFKLLPEPDALDALLGCFVRFQDTADNLVDALDEVLSEALPGGEDSPRVTIEGNNFSFNDGDMVMNGTIALIPPSVTFTFTDDDEGTTGSTDGPIIVLIPLVGEGTVTVNGTVTLAAEGDACTGTFRLAGAQFQSDGESFEFDDGRTVLSVVTPQDTLQLEIDFGAPSGGGGGIDLGGVTFRINGTPLPQTVIFPLIFFFELID